MTGDVDSHRALLRTDPSNKLAALSLPSNALAMLPIVQDLIDTEAAEAAYGKEVPYMPSFVLPLEEMSDELCNVRDFIFLPGFNNPTMAFLYEPHPTSTGRLDRLKDTFKIEVRTLDVLSKAYASLSTCTSLPFDSQYILACPASIGGIIVVTSTALVHVSQNGKKVVTSVNGWFSKISNLEANREFEDVQLELNGSGAAWADDKNLAVILRDGRLVQVRLELEGRTVQRLSIIKQDSAKVVEPVTVTKVGDDGLFIGSAVGDSALYEIGRDYQGHDAETDRNEQVLGDHDMDLDEGEFFSLSKLK